MNVFINYSGVYLLVFRPKIITFCFRFLFQLFQIFFAAFESSDNNWFTSNSKLHGIFSGAVAS